MTEKLTERVGLSRSFRDAVVADNLTKEAAVNQLNVHAFAYSRSELLRVIILQILTLFKYLVFAIVVSSFPNWIHQYVQFASPELERAVIISAAVYSSLLLLLMVFPTVYTQFYGTLLFRKLETEEKPSNLFFGPPLIVSLSRKWPIILGALCVVVLGALQHKRVTQPLDHGQQILYVSLVLTMAVALSIGLISALGHLFAYVFNRLRNKKYAESMIVIHLVLVLAVLRDKRSSVSESWRRRQVIDLLESIAFQFESSLPKQILGNELNSASLKQDLAKIGGGVRALKRRVAIPTSKLWDDELRRDLSDFLLKFLSLDWASLPQIEAEKLQATSLLSQLLAFLRSLAAGAIPLLLLAVLQSSPFALTGQRREIALIVAVAWFALSIVLRLDPEFNAKTKALKEVQDIIPFKP